MNVQTPKTHTHAVTQIQTHKHFVRKAADLFLLTETKEVKIILERQKMLMRKMRRMLVISCIWVCHHAGYAVSHASYIT